MFAMGPALLGRSGIGLTYAQTVLLDSPYAYWQMNEASGSTFTDSSGNNRNGNYIASPALGSTGLVRTGGTSVAFNGTNQYADMGGTYAPLYNLNRNFSIEWWMDLTSLGSLYGIWSAGLVGTGIAGLYIRITTTGGLEVLRDNTASLYTIAAGFEAETTYQCVFSYGTANDYYLHINGSLFANGTNSGTFQGGRVTIAADSNAPLSSTYTNFLKGRMGHMSVYTTKLSDARIAAHYAAGH